MVSSRVATGTRLLHAFSSGTGSGTECTLGRFAGDTELRGVFDTLREGTMQRDLGNLQHWLHVHLMRFKKAQCSSCLTSPVTSARKCGKQEVSTEGDQHCSAELSHPTAQGVQLALDTDKGGLRLCKSR